MKSLSLYGFEEGKIWQVYQDIEGQDERFALYRHAVLPNGEMGAVESLVPQNQVATNLAFTWDYTRSEDATKVLLYGFSGKEENRKRTYNKAHLILTDNTFKVLRGN